MKKYIINYLISYLSKRVLECDKTCKMFLDQDSGYKYAYAIGLCVLRKRRYLKKIEALQRYLEKNKSN